VDSTGQIDEGAQGEKNNTSPGERLAPKCVADKGKGSGAIAGPGVAKKDPLMARGKEKMSVKGSLAPDRRGRSGEDDSRVAIADLELKGSQVVVTLAREGKPLVELADAAGLQLEVWAGRQRQVLPLMQADPNLQKINGRGGRVVFVTDIVLEKSGPVMARLIGGEGKVLTKMLSPGDEAARRVLSSAQRMNELEPLSPDGLRPAMDAARMGAASDGTGPAGTMMAERLKIEPGENPSAVPLMLDRGIRILNPTGGSYYQGETITIAYVVTREGVTSGNLTFTVMNQAGVEAGTITVPFSPEGPVYFTLRENAPPGEYVIMGSHPESGASGISDSFQVHNLANARIDFLTPEGGSEHHPGESMTVRYRFNKRVPPGTVTFSLYHAGTVVSTRTAEYLPLAAGASDAAQIRELTWPLPFGAEVPSGDYAIFAAHPVAGGFSPTFAIRSIGHGDGTVVQRDLELVDIWMEPNSSEAFAEPEELGMLMARVYFIGDSFPTDLSFFIRTQFRTLRVSPFAAAGTSVRLNKVPLATMEELSVTDDCGAWFDVIMDPDNAIIESNEDNNSIRGRRVGVLRLSARPQHRLTLERHAGPGGTGPHFYADVNNGGSVNWNALGVDLATADFDEICDLQLRFNLRNCGFASDHAHRIDVSYTRLHEGRQADIHERISESFSRPLRVPFGETSEVVIPLSRVAMVGQTIDMTFDMGYRYSFSLN